MDWKLNIRFRKIYPHVLNVEGGFANLKNDKGGPTQFGIAYNYNAGWLKRYGINSPMEIRNLTKDQAIDTYYLRYWLPSQSDELRDDKLALVYFDTVINNGQGAADKILANLDPKHWHIAGNGQNVGFFWGLSTQFLLRRLYLDTTFFNWKTFGLGWLNRMIHIVKVLQTF